MGSIHIIALIVLAIFLFTAYIIMKIHQKDSVLSKEQDYITTGMKKLKKHIQSFGVPLKLEMYFAFLIVSPLFIGIYAYLFTDSAPFSVLMGLSGFLVPEGIIHIMKMRNDRLFEERFARSLEQLSSSLRAGMSIAQSVEDTANCKFLHESMRKRYAKLSSDLQMGLTVAEAFRRFAEDTNNNDAMDVALAIDIQNEIGGHEAEVIKGIANNITTRIMLRREIKSIMSNTSSLVWILDVLLPILFIGTVMIMPEYVNIYFTDPLYFLVFLVFVAMIILGMVINHSMLRTMQKGA